MEGTMPNRSTSIAGPFGRQKSLEINHKCMEREAQCDNVSPKHPMHVLLQICLLSNDAGLWTEFIRRSQPMIAGVIVKAMRRWRKPCPFVVDDLVQETYLKLCANDFKCLREFVCEHESALYGFLKVVASHVVHDHFRSSYSQ